MQRRGAKSFVDDLVLSRGVVLSRAATTLRSIETKPFDWKICPLWTGNIFRSHVENLDLMFPCVFQNSKVEKLRRFYGGESVFKLYSFQVRLSLTEGTTWLCISSEFHFTRFQWGNQWSKTVTLQSRKVKEVLWWRVGVQTLFISSPAICVFHQNSISPDFNGEISGIRH